jgi:hypothetical protein
MPGVPVVLSGTQGGSLPFEERVRQRASSAAVGSLSTSSSGSSRMKPQPVEYLA